MTATVTKTTLNTIIITHEPVDGLAVSTPTVTVMRVIAAKAKRMEN